MGPVVFFDGVCNLCNRSVDFIIRRDKKGVFRFASLQSRAASALLSNKGISSDNMQSMVLLKQGVVYLRSDAVLEIARDLGGFWRLFYVFKIIPVALRDLLYNWIARNRYRWFGRREVCRVPTPQEQARFLSDNAASAV